MNVTIKSTKKEGTKHLIAGRHDQGILAKGGRREAITACPVLLCTLESDSGKGREDLLAGPVPTNGD